MARSQSDEQRTRLRQAERELSAQHHESQVSLQTAVTHLQEMVAEFPTAAVSPDSNLALAHAKTDYQNALARSQQTLQRLVNFILKGTIPGDLEP